MFNSPKPNCNWPPADKRETTERVRIAAEHRCSFPLDHSLRVAVAVAAAADRLQRTPEAAAAAVDMHWPALVVRLTCKRDWTADQRRRIGLSIDWPAGFEVIAAVVAAAG